MPPEDSTSTGDSGDGTSATDKTLTQDQVDRIVEERLARERKKFADYNDLKAKADKLDELDDKNKTEVERLTAQAAQAEKRAAEAEAKALRLEVALDKGLNKTQARRLVGDNEEDLAADADDLIASFRPADTGDGTDADEQSDGTNGDRSGRRPVEKLKSGATSGSEDDDVDPDAIADRILSKKTI